MTVIHDPVEWLKAQVEMYLDDRAPYLAAINCDKTDPIVLRRFIEYMEEKYAAKGLFDR